MGKGINQLLTHQQQLRAFADLNGVDKNDNEKQKEILLEWNRVPSSSSGVATNAFLLTLQQQKKNRYAYYRKKHDLSCNHLSFC